VNTKDDTVDLMRGQFFVNTINDAGKLAELAFQEKMLKYQKNKKSDDP
jgi:hypothetical protein